MSLVGRQYTQYWIKRFPARDHPCALCTRRAATWDHCHTHGIVRGALCSGCNRMMVAVDAGTADPQRTAGEFPVAVELCQHGRTRFGDRWMWPDWTLFAGCRWSTDDLLARYRTRCTQCDSKMPAVAPWVGEAQSRAELAERLRTAGWWFACQWCPVVQTLHGVPVNGSTGRYREVGKNWRSRLAGAWTTPRWVPHGTPGRERA